MITHTHLKAFAITLSIIEIHELDTITLEDIDIRANLFSQDVYLKWMRVIDAYHYWYIHQYHHKKKPIHHHQQILIEAKILPNTHTTHEET